MKDGTGGDQAMAHAAPVDNERLVIEIAISVLCGKGMIEEEKEVEPDEVLIADLARLYQENPLCQTEVTFTGEILHDLLAGRPGEYLAAAYERECEERWEREEAPRWNCPCGLTFGAYNLYQRKPAFYTFTDDGLFDKAVAVCPNCKRNIAKVREQHADGQLGFAF
jgi:hypothetical protein